MWLLAHLAGVRPWEHRLCTVAEMDALIAGIDEYLAQAEEVKRRG